MKNKTTAIVIIIVLFLGLAGTAAYAAWERERADTAERYVNAYYQKAFNELVTNLEEMNTALQKSLYATSTGVSGALCAEVYGKAAAAQLALASMPFSIDELEQTSAFLSHVGDYALAMARSAMCGNSYSEEERGNLMSLAEISSLLSGNMAQIRSDVMVGEMSLDDILRASQQMGEAEKQAVPSTLSQGMKLMEKEFPEAPSLIYDGPFSEHISSAEPRLLEGKDKISAQDAMIRASKFLGISMGRLNPAGEMDGDIPSYVFLAQNGKSEFTVTVTKTGGEILSVLAASPPQASKINEKEALAYARNCLERWGFENMKESYHFTSDNVMLINYAYEQDGVLCYSDLIKVGISLEDGSLTCFEALGYISSHTGRELPQPAVDADTARQRVPSDLSIQSENMTLIPTLGKYEVLCYEFVCQNEREEHYIIYVDAESGQQQKILILLEDESGALTI